jgi:hypothetical protein
MHVFPWNLIKYLWGNIDLPDGVLTKGIFDLIGYIALDSKNGKRAGTSPALF